MELCLSPERQPQLDDYPLRRGQDPAVALDEVLAVALDEERQDSLEAVEGIRRGYESMKAGRTRPAADFIAEVREKYGFQG